MPTKTMTNVETLRREL